MEEILHRLYNVDVFQPRTPFFNIGTESPRKQVCANDGNLAPPQTEQLSMLKKGGVGTRRRVIQDAFYVGGARFPPSTDWMYLAKTDRQCVRVSYMLIERQTRLVKFVCSQRGQ